MPSEKFRITTNGQSLRNPNNGFFGMTLSANMTLDESDVSAHNDRRSAHNALERQRREHLNVKFQQLAHALPALTTVRRPSKTMIVAKSLEFVSSSLKRETTYMSEIQKLRLENEKLRKQAETSTTQLKKQIVEDEQEQSKPTTSSLKRKASTDSQQLSPPPTPEQQQQQQQQRKKRMVKQTKAQIVKREPQAFNIPSTSSTTTTTAATIATVTTAAAVQLSTPTPTATTASSLSPWTPLLDEKNNNFNTYPTSSPPNYFDVTTPYTNTSPNNDLLFLTPTPAIDMYNTNMSSSGGQYNNMMNPMLLSPYFVSTNENTDIYYNNPQDNFY
ncbi:hypothetical protein HPULCUR_003045 [Helicostylum pulchrum]|uniref:BHLH domain-containing protein n=1 Tax=Helicostylum pulchrum TaxID=562976 RepID=A0ABP9XSA6_9FUNG